MAKVKSKSSKEKGKYAQERYNPTFPHCSNEVQLSFNGHTLTMKSKLGSTGFKAVSGKPIRGGWDYSVDRQKKEGEGPIPAGEYWIRPDELWENTFFKRVLPWNLSLIHI